MNRDVKKVSWDGERVVVRWEVPRKGGTDEFSISCLDAPAPELLVALAGLRTDVAEICELPATYCANLEIRGVSFSYGGEARVMGATITALRHVTTANAPLVLNTPHLAEEPYAEGGDTDKLLSSVAVEALNLVASEALRYVDGHRAQGDLFAKDQKREPALAGAEAP
jgi:hypothetical protein